MTALRTQVSHPTYVSKWLFFEHMMIIIRIPILHVTTYAERKRFSVNHCKKTGGNCGKIIIVSSL